MVDIKGVITALTISGKNIFRSPAARRQIVEMMYLQTKHAIGHGPTFLQTVLRLVIRLYLGYIAGKYFVYRLFLHPANQLPGPCPNLLMPFFGNLWQLLFNDVGDVFRAWGRKYGTVFRYFDVGNRPCIMIGDPDLVKQVLVTEEFNFIIPPKIKQFLSLFLGEGILVAEGQVHQYQRRMLNPAFGVGALRGMIPSMVQPTQQLVHQWWQQCNKQQPTPIEVFHGLQLLTLEIIGAVGFGEQFDCLQHPEKNNLTRAYVDLFRGESMIEYLIGKMCPSACWLPFGRPRQVMDDMKVIQTEVDSMVEAAAAGRRKNNLHGKKDILTLMMQQVDDDSGKTLTAKELRGQCLTFIAGGLDTTSLAVTWCLHSLAHHQDIQDALRKEIRSAFPGLAPDNEDPTDDLIPSYDEFNQLPLLNNVCKESLRYSPPVPISYRTSNKDFTLHHTSLPKGTYLAICPLVSHFDKQQWGDDADQFVPSRWDRAPANKISPYVYLPFLAGGRQCIAYRFALIEFKVILALLIKNFKFTPKPGFNVRQGYQVTLRALPNMTLMVEKVD